METKKRGPRLLNLRFHRRTGPEGEFPQGLVVDDTLLKCTGVFNLWNPSTLRYI